MIFEPINTVFIPLITTIYRTNKGCGNYHSLGYYIVDRFQNFTVPFIIKQMIIDYMAKVLKPPSTTATVPVTNAAASLIRYWMVPHSSSGLPMRPNGV